MVTMRNLCSAALPIAVLLLPAFASAQGAAGLSIANYRIVSQERFTRTQSFVTYQADLVNAGVSRSGVTATVTSLVSTVQVVAGQGVLHFAPVPANSQVASADTFTLLIDGSVPFDLTSLAWSFLNPVANPGPNQTAHLGSTVFLNGGGSSNPSGVGTLTYRWMLESWPDGSRAALLNPDSVIASFVVDAPGSYGISLTVNNGSASDKALVVVSTGNSPPVANAGPNQTAPLGASVTLSGSASSDVDGDPLTYLWGMVSRPAGSTAELSGQRSVAPSFIADRTGTYIAQLIVNDGTIDSVPATVTISVASANTPPVANAGPNQTVATGVLVHLSGAGSTDVDGDALTYKWSLIAMPFGSAAALSDPAAVNPTFTADRAGTYIAQLIVNDGKVDSAASMVSIATNSILPPTANAGPNQTVALGALVTLSGSGTDPQLLPLTFAWSLATRPSGSVAALSALNIANPTFLADAAGVYVAQLVVNNGSLSSTPATVTITTANTPPVADAGPSRTVPAGVTVSLDGSRSSDADHNLITYSWALMSRPPGSAATLQNVTTVSPFFFADVAGTYVAQLIVNDGLASSPPSTVTITAGSTGITLSPNPLVLLNSQAALIITLPSPAPAGGIEFSVTSSNPAVASVPPGVFLSETASSVGLRVIRGVAGSAVIHVSAPGIPDGTANVTVPPPGSISLGGPASIGLNQTGTLTVTLSAPAPVEGVTVQLASSDPAKVTLPATTLYIAPGATAASTPPLLIAINVGSAAITASAPGYTASAPLVVNVTASISWVSQGVTINGIGQQAFLILRLSTHAPLDPASSDPWSTGLPVILSSSNPNVATIQATGIFIWDGSNAPGILLPVTATGPGTAVIHASGVNIPDVTTTVTVVN